MFYDVSKYFYIYENIVYIYSHILFLTHFLLYIYFCAFYYYVHFGTKKKIKKKWFIEQLHLIKLHLIIWFIKKRQTNKSKNSSLNDKFLLV